MSLNTDAENLLEAALDQAFTPIPVRKDVPQPPETGQNKHEVAPPQASRKPSLESAQEAETDSWKEEYEAQVRKWRVQSAEAREKAEKERARWGAIRAVEKEESARKEAGSKGPEQEGVNEKKGEGSSNMPVSETSGRHTESDVHTHAEATDAAQNWEDVHSSVGSSFPSMTFPERTATPSPAPAPGQSDKPQTATLSIFNSSLSVRTRTKAVLSSLAINLLLPFVNGVMLGFGELFAKNVIIGWFGWKQQSVAGSTGIGTSSRRQRPPR